MAKIKTEQDKVYLSAPHAIAGKIYLKVDMTFESKEYELNMGAGDRNFEFDFSNIFNQNQKTVFIVLKRVDSQQATAAKLAQAGGEYFFYFSDSPVDDEYKVAEFPVVIVVLAAVGFVVVLIVLVVVCVCCCKKKKKSGDDSDAIKPGRRTSVESEPIAHPKRQTMPGNTMRSTNHSIRSPVNQQGQTQFGPMGYPPQPNPPMNQGFNGGLQGPNPMYGPMTAGPGPIGFPGQPNIQQPGVFGNNQGPMNPGMMGPTPGMMGPSPGMMGNNPVMGMNPPMSGQPGDFYRPSGMQMPNYDMGAKQDPFMNHNPQNEDLPIFEVDIKKMN